MTRKKKQKRKVEIVFDAKSRKEFLTGFHKRKNARKKRAKEQLDVLLKAAQKRIRLEVKDSVKHLKKSYEPIPDIQHLLDEEEYEDDQVQVKIVDLSSDHVANQMNFIGENKPKYSDNEEEEKSEEEADDNETEAVPGMSTIVSKKEKKVVKEKKTKAKIDRSKITCKKDLDKITKKSSRQSLRKDKLFKMKSKLDSAAGKKKARKERRRNDKIRNKKDKRKGKFNQQK